MPVLEIFIEEVESNADPAEMMRYLLGERTLYKVIKESGNVSLQSSNMGGSLKWEKRIPLPSQIT